jgi:hypothetical protein
MPGSVASGTLCRKIFCTKKIWIFFRGILLNSNRSTTTGFDSEPKVTRRGLDRRSSIFGTERYFHFTSTKMPALETACLLPHEYRYYFLVTYSDRSMKMTAHIHLVPRLKNKRKGRGDRCTSQEKEEIIFLYILSFTFCT